MYQVMYSFRGREGLEGGDVMDMKAWTMSLAHGRVMKMTFEPLKGQYQHSFQGECQQLEQQPQTLISYHSLWGKC